MDKTNIKKETRKEIEKKDEDDYSNIKWLTGC